MKIEKEEKYLEFGRLAGKRIKNGNNMLYYNEPQETVHYAVN